MPLGTKFKQVLDKSIPHCKRCLKNLDKDGKCYLCDDKVKYLIELDFHILMFYSLKKKKRGTHMVMR